MKLFLILVSFTLLSGNQFTYEEHKQEGKTNLKNTNYDDLTSHSRIHELTYNAGIGSSKTE